jgi:arylsulfatase A-like enzyme
MRYQHLATGALLPAVLHLALLATSVARAEVSKPNIILIIADDHAWTDYSFMGHPQVRTPSIDRLAREGLCFRRGYVPSSLCCPSLATIMTGRYPHEHKIVCNDPPKPAGVTDKAQQAEAFRRGREKLNQFMEAQPTLPRLLVREGYLALQTGKWWQGHYRHGGFTHGMTRGEETPAGRHGDEGLAIGRQTMQPIYDFIDLARKENKPFLVWYAPMLPHSPHTPPQRLLDKYRDQTPSLHVARYWAMVEWFDETCGQLLDYLDRKDLTRNTIVVYLADNGWIQSPDGPGYAPKSKQSPYDGGLRTPIIVRWPGQVKPRQSDVPASSIDLLPTLLAAAGVTAPTGLPGVNLVDDAALKQRDGAFGAVFTHDAVDLDAPAKGLRFRWCVAGDWKIIVPSLGQQPKSVVELYDLSRDPHETRNLADAEGRRVDQLRQRLDAWWAPAVP